MIQTQPPRIVHQSTLLPDQDLVLVIRSGETFPSGLFTQEEKAFVGQQEAKKIRQVPLYRSGHWLVIRFLPEETDPDQQREACRKAGDELQQWVNGEKLNTIAITGESASGEEMLAVAEGMVLGNYQFLAYKTRDIQANTLKEIILVSDAVSMEEVHCMEAVVTGIFFTRDLVNEPYSTLTTARFAAEVGERAARAGISVDVLEKKKLEALQMGGILGVNRGSKEPPVMMILEYRPDHPVVDQPIVLVGKGIVYDTGGMNLKPDSAMETMKHDMAGGAAVAGAILAIAEARMPVPVIALIPVTDNRPGEEAIVSGDVLRMHNGLTVEVINTDAEGRLILADALSYAARYNPMLILELSTLTGSAIRCIGKLAIAGMESGAARFMPEIRKAGIRVHERIIEFPLWSEYSEPLKSEIADLRNLGGPFAGVIIAGMFLKEFTAFPYVHLDIAGPAFLEKRDSYRGTGASGVGVRLLFSYLQTLSNHF